MPVKLPAVTEYFPGLLAACSGIFGLDSCIHQFTAREFEERGSVWRLWIGPARLRSGQRVEESIGCASL
ncbi:MAG TPA: hypothetical protein VH107_12050 [Lacipirellulaceae bacterium]|nr:hypothetical protein [Lacipirellulaceae bacterium]